MFKKFILKLEDGILKHYKKTLFLVLIFTMFMGFVSYKYFNLKTSLTVLLPPNADAVVNLRELEKRKGSTDTFIVVLENENLDESKKFATTIYERLKDDPYILAVEHRRDVSFLKDRLLLNLSKKELLKIKNKLNEKVANKKFDKITDIGLDEDLKDDAEVLEDEGDPFKKEAKNNVEKDDGEVLEDEGDPFKKEAKDKKVEKDTEKEDFLTYIDKKITIYKQSFAGRFREWRVSNDEKILVVMITPAKPAAYIKFTKKFVKHIDNVITGLKNEKEEFKEIKVSYSGSYMTVLSETNEIKKEVFSSIGLSLFLIFTLLFLYFGRIRYVVTIFIPLILGMIWTNGVYFLFEEYLNLIAAFIFAILLGLGIDFGIHIIKRYTEERKNNNVEDSIKNSLSSTGKAILIGGITTIASFISLIFADFRGFSQFGILASLGIALNLVTIYIVFPIIVIFFEKKGGFRETKNYYLVFYNKFFKGNNFDFMKLSKYGVLLIVLLFVSLGVYNVFKHPEFEYNFSKLNKKNSKKKLLVKKYASATKQSLSPIAILSSSKEETKAIHDYLFKITKYKEDTIKQPAIFPIIEEYNTFVGYNNTKSLKMVASIYSFYPDHQKEKEKIIKDIDNILRPSRIKNLNKDEKEIVEKFKPYLKNAKSFKLDDLPEFIKNLFVEVDKNYTNLLFLYTKLNTSNGRNAIKLANEIRAINVNGKKLKATGQSLIFADILTLMIKDGVKVALIAFIFIVIILLLFEKSIKRTLFFILPLILGLLLTFFIMRVFDLKLTFFNISVLPALIGMGIDNSIHLTYKIEEENNKNIIYAYKSIIGSITMATLTTMIGFGGLLIANHRGLNTIGELAIIGMSSMWIIIVFPIPLLIQAIYKNKKISN